ncbi:hypothetical protein N7478_006318 [Penicillium angulare]|uniref:uncharacterized protein n=1 Tax=Penicillium angulare TaxID=116970 RepID=UPI002540388E|nr:uncharacterized protein N7478_006318 [Penicillium angulare]KAJ5280946.1 hypothetical protein N7478_006318 [Penicillium angulare]
MRASTFLAMALATLGASADSESTTTVGFFAPAWTIEVPRWAEGAATSYAASMAGINAKAATYHVGCAKDVPKSVCDIPKSWTIIQGSDTASFSGEWVMSTASDKTTYKATLTETWDCDLHSSTGSASCTMSASWSASGNGEKASSSTSTTTSLASAPTENDYNPLTVTAGLSSATKAAATKSGGAVGSGAMITAAPVFAAAAMAALL